MLRAAWLSCFVVLVACSERFPIELEKPVVAGTPANGPGLDKRPIGTTCNGRPQPPGSGPKIGLAEASPVAFAQPTEIALHDGRLYVLERAGVIRLLSSDRTSASTVLDLRSRVTAAGEGGLLGIAFHPQFATNGFVYLYFTTPKTGPGIVFESLVARYHSNDNGLTLDLASEKRIFAIDQPFSNHNGGTIAFGNDGLFYFALGDGGGAPLMRSQDTNNLLGKIVRLDVDGGDPYAVPPTNPFVAAGGGRGEIWALGLRNPFRFRFDRVTGDMWIGDVGAGAREEIDKGVLGGNYGWPLKEGFLCYTAPCDPTFVDPVVDHMRDVATTITGGVVYRGSALPLLSGKYVYGDFSVGSYFAIPINEAAPTPLRLDDRGFLGITPVAFELDTDGEILVASLASGRVLKIVPPGPPSEAPTLLSQTGCVDANNPRAPAAGLVPYGVVIQQWMDGARATRFVSVPDGATIGVGAGGRLELPPDSVAMRTLDNGTRQLETQLLRRRPDGTWHAARYVWVADQSDAVLAPEGSLDCGVCHKAENGTTVGLEAAQLDRASFDYGQGRLGNPLVTFEHIGLVAAPVPRDSYRPLPANNARGYLHANCAFCHHGGNGAAIDLRVQVDIGSTKMCEKEGSLATGGRFVLAPGNPAESQLVSAMRATGPGRMPPAGTLLVDERGVTQVEELVRSVSACR